MPSKLTTIFGKDHGIIIGALHLPPLLGFADFAGYTAALEQAIADIHALESGGVDGVFIENNYGLSGEKVDTGVAIAMGYLIGELKKHTKLPLGASVLWNDYGTAFALANTYQLQFIRIPVFVDVVEPYCGRITGTPEHVKATRKLLQAENVAIFTDILVKHSTHITTHSLATAAKKAITAGSDAIIVTGNWTGQSPQPEEVDTLRLAVGSFPILIGSGVDATNVTQLLSSANGAIVSTSLKHGEIVPGERNVKKNEQRISIDKVRRLMTCAHN